METKKYKFQDNIWIKFTIDGIICIGKTMLDSGIEYVIFVSDKNSFGKIEFNKITDVVRFDFKIPASAKSINFSKMDEVDMDMKTEIYMFQKVHLYPKDKRFKTLIGLVSAN